MIMDKLPIQIGLASRSPSVDFQSLVHVAGALNLQISRDAAPIWGVAGTVTALPDPDNIGPGIWPVFVMDDMPDGMGGYHSTGHNQPFAMILAGDTWSLAASHEVLEMLVDPSGNRLVAAPAVAVIANDIEDAPGKYEYLVEVCDPSEDPDYAYLIDSVLVSDFYTPNYFDPVGSAGARYSFSGKITRPRQVLKNGYLSWYNPSNNKLQQIRHFGAPSIVDLGTGEPGASLTGGLSLRAFVDSHTPPPETLSQLRRSTTARQARDVRRSMLAAAAPQRAGHYTACIKAIADRTAAAAAAQATAATADAHGVLAANVPLFGVPGVLAVRSGWHIGPRGMTGARAIVVTAMPDRLASVTAALPATLQGIPIDIRPASPLQEMQIAQPAQYMMLGSARHEARQPEFADQVFFDGNGSRTDAPSPAAAFAAARLPKPELNYAPPAGASLAAVNAQVTLVLHASPDAGWDRLADFLAGVKQNLVVGMYDFTSGHILAAVQQAMAGKALTLTLDHPAPNPSRDQTDDITIQTLSGSLGNRFRSAWALTNADRMATAWIYPNAYHIKVAVRDDGVFWLSSGNWNNSNQPQIDLSDPAAASKTAAASDRDWHVIATCPTLADTFRQFLQNDYAVASQYNLPPVDPAMQQATPTVEMPAAALAAGRAPRTFFPPKTISGVIPIQPLLTPDNYQGQVKALIESATEKFYMQTQYIHPSDRPGDAGHAELIAAVKGRIDAGVDVRLITSEFQTDDWVEKLVDAGIPGHLLRRQPHVHNKGIVVDGSMVMVSSQNWSADGTLRNRDAGLIITSAEAAAYFEMIFLHDWDNMASPVTQS
jgi:hypothetical protein